MPNYVIPVRFSGKLEYRIPTAVGNEDAAMAAAEELASEQNDFNRLEDIDFEVKPPVAIEPDNEPSRTYIAVVKSSAVRDTQIDKFCDSEYANDAAWADIPNAELYAGTYCSTEAGAIAAAAAYMGTDPANIVLYPVNPA